MMITLFTRKHNAICDRLCTEYPPWSDDDLFERARLINAALTAKIYTVEWTPAINHQPSYLAGCAASQLVGHRNGAPPTTVRSPECQRRN